MPTNLVVVSICLSVGIVVMVVGHFTMFPHIRRSFDSDPKDAIPWGMYSTRDKIGFSLVVIGGLVALGALPAFITCSVYCSK